MNIHIPCLSAYYHSEQKKNRQLFLLSILLLTAACSAIGTTSSTSAKKEAIIVAHNDMIAAAGQKALEKGGNAADAMAAMLMTGSVVMPSRIGLGAGGVCQVLNPTLKHVETIDFISQPMSFDKKIGTPSLPRGVYVLKSKYGNQSWNETFSDAVTLAEKGFSISPLLAKDIQHTKGLPTAWRKLQKNDTLQQPELSKTLRLLSQQENVDILYSGEMANSLVSQSDQIVQEDLKATKADVSDSIDVVKNAHKTFFPNPTALSSADGYMIWNNLQKNPEKNAQAQQQLKTIQKRFIDVENSAAGLSFIAGDASGLVVSCSVSMGSPFGSKILSKEGFYLSKTVLPKDRGYIFFNVLQTDSDTTNVMYALVGAGDTALIDGLTTMAKMQPETGELDAKPTKTEMTELICEEGYPDHVNTCKKTDTLIQISQKQKLTK